MMCPGFDQLMDYCEGLLGERDAQLIAAHLASGCQQCIDNRQWYERTRDLAAGDVSVEPPPWVLKRAVKLFHKNLTGQNAVDGLGRLVALLTFDSWSQSALVGVRLAETADRQLLYYAGQYSIDLQIVQSSDSPIDVNGQILRKNESRFESVGGLSLSLMREGDIVRDTVTNQVGEFTISPAEPGEYDLLIETRDGIIIVSRLPIRPS